MKQKILLLLMLTCTLPLAAQERAEVLLETTEGDIRIALYNETPLHRDNFLKLVKMHVYDSLLFHRVIKDFMIQGGDLNSKHAQPGQLLGTGDLDYTIESEFRLPQIFHRRGVVAAAREPDEVNPDMRSSACQFYIVWGRTMDDARIQRVQQRLDTLTHGRVQLTSEMIDVYKTTGGTPHLDGQYTVFGEVLQGLDIVDKIQQVATDKNNRPLTDVRILRATILVNPFAPKEQPIKSKNSPRRRPKK